MLFNEICKVQDFEDLVSDGFKIAVIKQTKTEY